jgi:hypothetical protein
MAAMHRKGVEPTSTGVEPVTGRITSITPLRDYSEGKDALISEQTIGVTEGQRADSPVDSSHEREPNDFGCTAVVRKNFAQSGNHGS